MAEKGRPGRGSGEYTSGRWGHPVHSAVNRLPSTNPLPWVERCRGGFSRVLRSALRRGPRRGSAAARALVYSRPPGAFRSPSPSHSSPAPSRRAATAPARVTPDPDATWQRIRTELRRAVTDHTYHLWLEPL